MYARACTSKSIAACCCSKIILKSASHVPGRLFNHFPPCHSCTTTAHCTYITFAIFAHLNLTLISNVLSPQRGSAVPSSHDTTPIQQLLSFHPYGTTGGGGAWRKRLVHVSANPNARGRTVKAILSRRFLQVFRVLCLLGAGLRKLD